MKIKQTFIWSLVCTMALLSSCYYDKIEPLTVQSEVSFEEDIIPIFDLSCNSGGCHSTGGVSPDLTLAYAYDNLFMQNMIDSDNPEESLLYKRIISVSDPMPPSSKLSDYEINLILEWIKQGALNN